MINKLIEIAIEKQKNKRQLGIYLGFPEKYAGQRVDKIIKNQNFTMEIYEKLLSAAELHGHVELAIAAEHQKLFGK